MNIMGKFMTQNRRTLDLLSAKAFFYHSRVYELMGKLADVRRSGELNGADKNYGVKWC